MPAMTMNRHKTEELQRRMVLFGSLMVKIAESLPRTESGKHISRQILRSGTAPAANYGEAQGAESRADFVHKLRVVLKELNETLVWLQLIAENCLISRDIIVAALAENHELCRIIAASVKTARGFDR